MKKNVIILGMARSGTSLTASIFAKTGYYVDDENKVVEKDHLNPTGYWESRSLLKYNELILRASGFEYDNTWIYKSIANEQVDFITRYTLDKNFVSFVDRYKSKSPWVWKDPRLCYTLGCWWPLLDVDSTVVIFVKRNKEAIYSSFLRVGWRKYSTTVKAETFNRISAHINNAEKIIQHYKIPVVDIDYEDYKKNPLLVIEKINQACGTDLSVQDLDYNDKFNHYTFLGRLGFYIDSVVNTFPVQWIKRIKCLVPKFILEKLYPERYEK